MPEPKSKKGEFVRKSNEHKRKGSKYMMHNNKKYVQATTKTGLVYHRLT